jgi:hypothetical protein
LALAVPSSSKTEQLFHDALVAAEEEFRAATKALLDGEAGAPTRYDMALKYLEMLREIAETVQPPAGEDAEDKARTSPSAEGDLKKKEES